MIAIIRIDNPKLGLFSYKATEDESRAAQLDLLFGFSMSPTDYAVWHPLIAKPFNNPLPQLQHQARFRPAYGKNVFYGSVAEETVLYEYAFNFMKQRINMNNDVHDSGIRSIFMVDATEFNSRNIELEKNMTAIMDKNDYSASHEFVKNNPSITFIRYPSCRDPEQGQNIAILDIHHFEKAPKWETTIKYSYDFNHQSMRWLDYQLQIAWKAVS